MIFKFYVYCCFISCVYSQNTEMWRDFNRIGDVIQAAMIWLLTLEKQGCSTMLQAGMVYFTRCCFFFALTHTRPFYGPFSGSTRVSQCQKKSSGLDGAREDNRSRHTNNPARRCSIRTNQRPTSIIPLIFMPDALPAAAPPIYSGLGQAPNMLACIPSGFNLFIYCHCMKLLLPN